MSADDYDWLNSYWPHTNPTQGAPSSSVFQVQTQDGPGPSVQIRNTTPRELDPVFLAQNTLPPGRLDQLQHPYPDLAPYGYNWPHWPRAPDMTMQPLQRAPPAQFQRHYYPTPSMTASDPAATTARPVSQAYFAPPAPRQQQQQQPPPVPIAPTKQPTPRGAHPGHDAKRRRLDDTHNDQWGMAPPAYPSRDLSSYTFKPRNPTSKGFLRDRADLIQPLNEKDAADKTSYDSTTIARDILIAAGRHPREPMLNHHLLRLRNIFTQVDNTSDLDTFRWDIVDSPDMQVAPTEPASASKPSPAANGHGLHTQQPANHHPGVPSPRDQLQPMRIAAHPTPPPARPPPAVSIAVPRPPPLQQQPRPHKQPQQLQEVLLPQKASPPQLQRKDKPPKKPKQQPEKMVGRRSAPKIEVAIPMSASVSYPVYPCEWRGCQSELHNLDLLRQHLLKAHVPYNITCGWSGCTCPEKMAAAELFNHVKAQHVDPIAWKLGDGPSVPRTVDTEASQSPGIMTTPEANQPGGEDSLIFPASYSSIRAFNRVHGNTSQQDKAQEILKAVQRLKERVGVGLDPGGCQLATPARNEKVSNDEEVYELLSEPEPELARESESESES